jgi:hypothetical protein
VRPHADNGQSTQSELNFIRALGSGRSAKNRDRDLTPNDIINRQIKMLRGYIDALPLRVHWWDGANPKKFKQEAEKQLASALSCAENRLESP